MARPKGTGKMKGADSAVVCLRLTKAVHDRLSKLAEQEYRSVPDQVRMALDRHLAEMEQTAERQ